MSRLFLGTSIAAALVFFYLVASFPSNESAWDQTLASSMFFLQSAVELFLWHAVSDVVASLLDYAERRQTPFFVEAPAGLRRIAALLLVLLPVGLLFSTVMTCLAYGGVASVGVTLGYAGFPVGAAWSALAGGRLATGIPSTVTVPIGALFVPVVLFCVPYAFQFGSQLQLNEDRTL